MSLVEILTPDWIGRLLLSKTRLVGQQSDAQHRDHSRALACVAENGLFG
jgi:hypothetical protein